MEISDLIYIGQLKVHTSSKKPYIVLRKEYQHLLAKLTNIFLIFKDHRVRFVSIDLQKIIKEDRATVTINDTDVLKEVSNHESVRVCLDESEINDLDDDSIYYDPVSMRVIYEGEDVGEICHFFFNGAHYVYELKMNDGKEVLIPDVERYVIETDTEERFIKVVDLDQFLEL
jgi:ribosomal 30S subunit maturation factor RimM